MTNVYGHAPPHLEGSAHYHHYRRTGEFLPPPPPPWWERNPLLATLSLVALCSFLVLLWRLMP
jgi:hypothetical protein